MKQSNLFRQIFEDVDDKGSSKRLVFLWVSIVIWSFIHGMIFWGIKPFNSEIASTVIMYDMVLIFALAGMALSEKIWGREEKPQKDPKDPI